MKKHYTTWLAMILFFLLPGSTIGQNMTYSWRYYRPGNTGIQGDYNEAIWIDANADPYISGYDPFFEEGGFAKFDRVNNKWINYSNVDYPVIGDPQNVGSARIAEIVPDLTGKLWMANWTGIISFDPLIGASSLQRFDQTNSPHPGGRTVDIDVAPDGAIWATVISVSWGGGGLLRYLPDSDEWTYWNNGGEHIAIQPQPDGGYYVWIDIGLATVVFNSRTQQFKQLPNTGEKDQIIGLPGKDCVDDMGNLWAFRNTAPGDPPSLDYRDIAGVWHKVPFAYPYVTDDIWAYRAFGDKNALLVDGKSETWLYNGTTWENKGIWRLGGFTNDVSIDVNGNIWICGIGGAAIRNDANGIWQRYRVTNTSQFDNFNSDLTIDHDLGYVYAGANAAPGIGGMTRFDGVRWFGFNQATYGLGEDWPFPIDNCHALAYCPSRRTVAVSPYAIYGIHEWNGAQFNVLQSIRGAERLCEDSYGRVWSIGEYFDLRFFTGTSWTRVPIAGWGANIQPDRSRPGTVWACAGGMVVRTDGSYRFAREPSDFPELNSVSDAFTAVAADTGDIAWIGTTNGLIRINAKNGDYQYFSSQNSPLRGEWITPHVVSPDGRIWFTNFNSYTTAQIGLYWFNGKDFGFFKPKTRGFPHAQIADMEIRMISGGYELWMSCLSKGIAVLKVKTTLPVSGTEEQISNITVNDQKLNLSIFPNPVFNHNLTVNVKNVKTLPVFLSVFNMDGRIVYIEKITGYNEVLTRSMNLTTIPAGVYSLEVISGSEKQVKRFVKMK